MKTIKTIQKYFIKDLFNTGEVCKNTNLLGKYTSHHNLSSLQLIQIYQNNFFSTHIDSLKTSYSKTFEIIGKKTFEQTARDYIKAYPPKKESIQNYGHEFSNFLKHYKHTKNLLYLPDLAKLEFLLSLSYYSKNTECLNIVEFAKEQKKDSLLTRLGLHVSCHLILSSYPLDKIIKLTKIDTLKIQENKKFYFLIVRNNFTPQILAIKKESFAFLTEINNNKGIVYSTKKAIRINDSFNLQNELLFFLEQKSFMLKK
ncbi:MAG: DUF2063 domain-containing protein [Bdellovibrionales bacterium]|nr:DUF2063 domain-containing protein [Bdellovibrionales bacterium]